MSDSTSRASTSNTSTRVSSGGSRSSTYRKQNQLSQIEKSVTHLLIATKQLLETLTQWSRHSSSESEVSDVYVRLGYEFNIACRAFNSIGVDTSDLGPVPELLRTILEETLSQEASPASLDRYLPRIRDIIITLLHGLKRKQQKLRAKQNVEPSAASSEESVRKSSKEDKRSASYAPKEPSPPPVHRHTRDGSGSTVRNSHTNPTFSPSVSDSSISSTSSPSDKKEYLQSPPPPPPPKQQDALAALQRGGDLERRASRRYSAYQISKHLGASPNGMNFFPPAQTTPVPNRGRDVRDSMNAVRTRGSGGPFVSVKEPEEPSPAEVVPQAAEPPTEVVKSGEELTLFLQYKSKIKKFVLPNGMGDLSLARLQLAFIEKFAWNTHSNGIDLPEIYVQDPVSGVRHELEDLGDVKDRCVLALNVEALDEVKRHMDDNFSGLRKMVETLTSTVEEQRRSLQRVSEQQTHAAKLIQSNSSPPPPPQTFEPPSKAPPEDPGPELGMPNAGRAYVNQGKKNLGEESERIVNLVDDLQDLVEDLRKDVVTRGVRPMPRQLDDISKRVTSATIELKKLQGFLRREKPVWTKIWEKELEVVCTDRDLLTMQEELAADLEDDLDKAMQTFALVEQATRQQNAQANNSGGTPRSNIIVVNPNVDPRKAKDGVLGEVRALRPNHEDRVEAIARAEKARQQELEERREGAFTKEVAAFVESGKLKKSGGFEAAEEARRARDEQNMRSAWQAQQDRAVSRSVSAETRLAEETEPAFEDARDTLA